ncbi:MAG: dependent oxidoreductase [Gammaproteobacteria bacterium]|jgi:glycine/D-amino acid oxidase-like deaminating enzyme/nitrite reductase/ring-hydroxylating ferredoxin subunit|nr:dependent oxidoreductase [Gammaproteobacteria bacterium]
MNKQPVWLHTLDVQQKYPPLKTSLDIDILIVGAGITGLTAAIQLKQSNKSIAVIDAHTIGSGTTGSSTANLYVPVQNYYHQIAAKFNWQVASQVAQSRKAAIDYIEQLISQYNINCSFQRRPWYMFTKLPENRLTIEREFAALTYCDMPVDFTHDLPLTKPFTKAIKLDNQARFNPLRYLYGLAEVLVKNGERIYEQTPIVSHKEYKDYCVIETPTATIKARKLLLATHIPVGFNFLQLKVYPYRSYAVAARLAQDKYPNGVIWDIDSPHFSISSHSITGEALDLLILAGNHHKTGQAKHCCHKKQQQIVEAYLKTHFDVASIDYEWSAQHYQSADGLPYIGLASRFSKNTYVATGYATDGLTYGTIAGILLADKVQAKVNPWADIYKTTRFTPLASAVKFTKENLNVLTHYLADYPGNVESQDYLAIKPGEGKIIEEQGEKWAVHRDENNQLHRVSAICTHMKCLVKWNDAEKTWDCPCHGSRFTIDGEIIEGPALTPLKKKLFHRGEEPV